MTDLDKAISRVKDVEDELDRKEKELREQVQYYKDKCGQMVEEKKHKEVLEEFNRLKREADKQNEKQYMYSPSTNITRPDVPTFNQPMSAQVKQHTNYDEFERSRGRIEVFSATKHEPPA